MISNLVLVSYFMQKEYRWHPQEERAIRAVFETKGSCILKSAMNKIRNGQDKGKWITANVRATLDEHWGSTDFLNNSSTAKANRSIDRGASAYCGGSISTATHFEKLVILLHIYVCMYVCMYAYMYVYFIDF